MALKKRQIKEDILWLKWSLSLLFLVITGAVSSYVSAFYFRNDMQREEFQALANYDLIAGQVREIESSEQIIIDNIGRFNTMLADSIMEEENRVDILEEIRAIREMYHLFPINVDIQEQNRLLLSYTADVESPEEQISLRSTDIRIQIPLLHEEDLRRFLTGFMGSGRLIVSNRCAIDETIRAAVSDLEFVEHQLASCDFIWYTLRREPFTGI